MARSVPAHSHSNTTAAATPPFRHFLVLPEQDIYKLILLYRWLSLLPPSVGILITPKFTMLTNAFYLSAMLLVGWQSWKWWRLRNAIGRLLKPPGLLSLAADLIFCAVLLAANGIWSSPYYLYSLGPIFLSAFFYGLRCSIVAGTALALSYLTALGSSMVLTGQAGNWLVSVTNVTGFILCSLLFGYQSAVSNQLKRQTDRARELSLALEVQNSRLNTANYSLQIVRHFSQSLQAGVDARQVYSIAIKQLLEIGSVTAVAIAVVNHIKDAEEDEGGEEEVKVDQKEKVKVDVKTWRSELVKEWMIIDRPGKTIRYLQTGLSSCQMTLPVNDEDIRAGLAGSSQLYITDQGVNLVQVRDQADRLLALLAVYPGHPVVGDGAGIVELPVLPVLADELGRTIGNLNRTRNLAIEAERARLAMDMHDAVSQSLFGLAYSLDGCVKLLPTRPELARETLLRLRAKAFSTLGSLRSIIYDLWQDSYEANSGEAGAGNPPNQQDGQASARPTLSSLSDLVGLLQNHIKNVSQFYSFPVQIEVDPQATLLKFSGIHQVKALYRITQEALANAARHAAPTEARLGLFYDQHCQRIVLIIADNGSGFDLSTKASDNSPAGQHLGLSTMRRRIEELDGTFQLESAPGKGTTITLGLPIAFTAP